MEVMSLEELKARCEELASVGDRQARSTLALIASYNHECERVAVLNETIVTLQAQIAMLARDAARRTDQPNATTAELIKTTFGPAAVATNFQGVKFHGQTVDDIIPRPPASVPPPRQLSDAPLRDPKGETTPTPEEARQVTAAAKEFGVSDHEVRAIQATRRKLGLHPSVDAPVIGLPDTSKPAGSYDKTNKMNDAAGNKE